MRGCISPWSEYGLHEDSSFEKVIAVSSGHASFLCKPPQEGTYNVTWTHAERIRANTGELLPDQRPPDRYVNISNGERYFVLVIDPVQRSSEGEVKCVATSHAHTYTHLFYLYVRTEAQFTFPMENETASLGTRRGFVCLVYFDTVSQDKCGFTQRFRWSHKGVIVSLPDFLFGSKYNAQKYWVKSGRAAYLNRPAEYYSSFGFVSVQKGDEGPVKCEVRYGPEDNDWAAQEAYLTVL